MSNREFVIPFVGLKTGTHSFEYNITDAFFNGIENSIIHAGNVQVRLELEKKEQMLIGVFQVEGLVTTNCDRCTEPIEVEVDGEYQIVYKFGGDPSENEGLVVLEEQAFELDIEMNIYELIAVALPIRSVHELEDCNPEMIALLNKYLINSMEDDEDDDFDDDDFDDDDFDDDDDDSDDDDSDDDDDIKDNGEIDPRWSILKNLN
jgi:uncharacterized metal-binding protein YceD (DUF177 family)